VCCFTDTTLPENEHSEVVENSTSIFICHDFTSSAASWRLVQKKIVIHARHDTERKGSVK